MFNAEFHGLMHSSVLCWLATVDGFGQPNVSPKEVFTAIGDRHLVLANIASPASVRNVLAGSRACASFVDIFVQKGYKVMGPARYFRRDSTEFAQWSASLDAMAEPKFTVQCAFGRGECCDVAGIHALRFAYLQFAARAEEPGGECVQECHAILHNPCLELCNRRVVEAALRVVGVFVQEWRHRTGKNGPG